MKSKTRRKIVVLVLLLFGLVGMICSVYLMDKSDSMACSTTINTVRMCDNGSTRDN